MTTTTDKTQAPYAKLKAKLAARWKVERVPGSPPSFSLKAFSADFGVAILLVALGFVLLLILNGLGLVGRTQAKTEQKSQSASKGVGGHMGMRDEELPVSNIIEFEGAPVDPAVLRDLIGPARAAQAPKAFRFSPGTLVRVRLLNQVETFGSVPVFAQIVDYALGRSRYGYTVIGEASGRGNSGRVEMNFSLVRDPRRASVSSSIAASALSPNGTLGIAGHPKEGLSERVWLGAAGAGLGKTKSLAADSGDKKIGSLLLQALVEGLSSELDSEVNTAHTQAAALTLDPGTEFLIQLTDFFPKQGGIE